MQAPQAQPTPAPQAPRPNIDRVPGGVDRVGEAAGNPAGNPASNPALEHYQNLVADFDRQGQEGLRQRFRQIGEASARLGRLGSGMTAEDVQRAGTDFERDRMSFLTDLADRSIDRNFQQLSLEDMLRNSEFNRNLARSQLSEDQAKRLGESAAGAGQSAADLLRLWMLTRGQQGGALPRQPDWSRLPNPLDDAGY
jgi:hypothetical protein